MSQDFSPKTKAAILSLCVVVIAACAMFAFTGTSYAGLDQQEKILDIRSECLDTSLAQSDAISADMDAENWDTAMLGVEERMYTSINCIIELQSIVPKDKCATALIQEGIFMMVGDVIFGEYFLQSPDSVGPMVTELDDDYWDGIVLNKNKSAVKAACAWAK